MPLLALWASNPEAISQLTVEQVVSNAGDGNLRDNTDCSQELRTYFSQVTTEKLAAYIERCLSMPFNGSGKVLQDLINELGRRLEYEVTNGRYQGTSNHVGYDGIWLAPDGHWAVIEVKTTDAYRISLDILANYRKALLQTANISNPSSILIVVGRQDTGDLEAQVRGSRHAWDVRLISADALVKLVKLKESTDDPETAEKIRSLLVPFEYTKLDEIIDVMFTTAQDVESATESETGSVEDEDAFASSRSDEIVHATDTAAINAKRLEIIDAIARQESLPLLKRSRAAYWDTSHSTRVICTVSKRYEAVERYWYAYHPKWDSFLAEGATSFFVLGCLDLQVAFAIPHDLLRSQLDHFNMTIRDNGQSYWHIKIVEREPNKFGLHLPKISDQMPLDSFMVRLHKDR